MYLILGKEGGGGWTVGTKTSPPRRSKRGEASHHAREASRKGKHEKLFGRIRKRL